MNRGYRTPLPCVRRGVFVVGEKSTDGSCRGSSRRHVGIRHVTRQSIFTFLLGRIWYTDYVTSRPQAVAKLVFFDLVGSVVWFPVWWYTRGIEKITASFVRAIRYRVQSYALRIWIRNFFVPMYGQHDWTSRLISVFMRFVVLVFRIIELAVESAVYALGVVAWGAAPVIFLVMGVLNLLKGAI